VNFFLIHHLKNFEGRGGIQLLITQKIKHILYRYFPKVKILNGDHLKCRIILVNTVTTDLLVDCQCFYFRLIMVSPETKK